jgi:membrane associated rhomboid family serine protease
MSRRACADNKDMGETPMLLMLRAPSPKQALSFPATAATLILSLAVTIAWWAKADCSALLADAHVARGQFHRLLTCALLHRDPVHLAFNFFWLWTFGTLIERRLGSMKTLLLFMTLAAASSAAEHAFFTAGVGLSGIVYGLFGFLWFFSMRRGDDDKAFADAIDRRTTICFVGWFVACIVLTLANVLPVGNLAHAVGALLGVAIARAMGRKGHLAAVAGAIAILLLAATFARPQLNCSSHRGEQEASLGFEALKDHDDRAAAGWMRDATALNPRIAAWWFNRGIAEARLQDHPAALISYNNACRLAPSNGTFRAARDALQDYLAAVEP